MFHPKVTSFKTLSQFMQRVSLVTPNTVAMFYGRSLSIKGQLLNS